MVNGGRLKDEMIENLWLPKAKEAGAVLYPRRRKHAQMRMLTLSDGLDLSEIFKLEEANLIVREDCVAWVCSMTKRWRVEADNIGLVIDGHVYDHSFLGPTCPLAGQFPFDILNLDFGSQDTDIPQGKPERQINKLEKAIGLQHRNGASSFLVIFTIPVESFAIDVNRVIRESDAISMNGWRGMQLGNFPQEISSPQEKRDFVLAVMNGLVHKYGYVCVNTPGAFSCSDSTAEMFSVAVVLVR